MCSPSGLICILITSLFTNCVYFSVAVKAVNNTVATKTNTNNNTATYYHLPAAANISWPPNTPDFFNNFTPNDHHLHSSTSHSAFESKSSSLETNGQFIDITRKHKIHYNGFVIDETNLLDHLEDHEKDLIFGKSRKKRSVKLVHLQYRTTARETEATTKDVVDKNNNNSSNNKLDVDNNVNADDAEEEMIPLKKFQSGTQASIQRFKRSNNVASASSSSPPPAAVLKKATTETSTATTLPKRQGGAPTMPMVSVQIKDNEHLVNLKLQQTPKLIDDSFVFIRRYANSSQLIENSHKLVTRLEKCFYHNENSALDLCDEENVRGVFHHNNTDFIIHPLPERFGNNSHIILESEREVFDTSWRNSSLLDENIQFEPDEEDFNDLNLELPTNDEMATMRSTRNIDSESEYSSSIHHTTHHHQLPLNLRFKPRHHHHHNHHQHHHHKTSSAGGHHKHHHKYPEESPISKRYKRYIHSASQYSNIPDVLHIETAIFVDIDLYKHMAKNFPKDTSSHLIRFVLAMINGVQLLYHHPSLGKRVNFVLKRLEILEKDPPELRRSSDIDIYLSNFCKWQNDLNPSEHTGLRFDHAVILTGLDLYVVGKNGKVISQVVGLAPVAGMCIPTSSCTINEGKHFESVFVVAHEIGHNLGMRHDTMEQSCDPTSHIMSPTLGSGKITWSQCSRASLNKFLELKQAKCLFNVGEFKQNLDHSADGILPGERFDANHQCMLKYGKDSNRARSQSLADICRDLHCQRDRYTWTSHPALEGTSCGDNNWCRSGFCVVKRPETFTSAKQTAGVAKANFDKTSFLETSKVGHLLHEYQKPSSSWSEWSEPSACDSSCLYGPSKRLREGSTGLKILTRKCIDYKRRCIGRDRKFETCVAKQCYSVPIITIEDFAKQVCERAQKFDMDLTGEGEQIVGNIEESCKVYCKTKANGTKSRSWTFPDGTTCRSKLYGNEDPSYCIQGRCEKFSCDNSMGNYYKIDAIFCKRQDKYEQNSMENDTIRRSSNHYSNHIPAVAQYTGSYGERNDNNKYRNNINSNYYDNERGASNSERIYGPTTIRSKYENEVALRPFHGQYSNNNSYKRKTDNYSPWNKYSYHLNDHVPAESSQPKSSSSLVSSVRADNGDWIVKSGCHSSCMIKSRGIQVVVNRETGIQNIQLCTHSVKPCERLQTTTEYADHTCARYKLKVLGLSGRGIQIASSVEDPDRSCRVGCQDEFIHHRFYLVNGNYGHFPLGTKCSQNEERYCVQGKCLEFGSDNIPLKQSHISLALFRSRRSLKRNRNKQHTRNKRSFLFYDPVNITETLTQEFINNIVNSIITFEEKQLKDDSLLNDHIEFTNPIHYSMDELNEN
ncbi:uncharacterized protein LOC119609992 [Lucilia sericata]|uniref:uncharacterized protein LOC119609992 n=1 Tax=Lucilia sericata TaxID=13632 RepID=UPI0018A870CE|nr:uncharacterized protein LOC119609992 [Lucilia sericata]